MPLSPTLAQWLRSKGHDAVHAVDLGMERAPDADLIERAIADSRVILTADLDYPRLLALANTAEPSLILFRGGDWSEADVISRFAQLLDRMEEAEIRSSILVID